MAAPDLAVKAHLAEFEALRREIDQRAGMQANVRLLCVTGLWALISIAVQQRMPELLLGALYLAAFCGFDWLKHAHRISSIGAYVRTQLSPELATIVGTGVLGWESWFGTPTAVEQFGRHVGRWAAWADWLLYRGSIVLGTAVPPFGLVLRSDPRVALILFLGIIWLLGVILAGRAAAAVSAWRRGQHRPRAPSEAPKS